MRGEGIQYNKRYDALDHEVPAEVLKIWRQNYQWDGRKSVTNYSQSHVKQNWSTLRTQFLDHLEIAESNGLHLIKTKIEPLARRLDTELANFSHKDSILKGLRADFLPGLKKVITSLQANRAPSEEVLRQLLPIVGKKWIGELLPQPSETLNDLRNLLHAVTPPAIFSQDNSGIRSFLRNR